jgi:hypothetical protein
MMQPHSFRVFLDKEPCCIFLPLESGLLDQPAYHALYRPDLYAHFFSNSNSVSLWLTNLYTICAKTDFIAEFEPLSSLFFIHNTDTLFYCEHTLSFLASASFHPLLHVGYFQPPLPLWLFRRRSEHIASLSDLKVADLRPACSAMTRIRSKKDMIDHVIDLFYTNRPFLRRLSVLDAIRHLSTILSSISVCAALLKPTASLPKLFLNPADPQRLCILSSILQQCSQESFRISHQLLSKHDIKSCLHRLHPSLKSDIHEQHNQSHEALADSLLLIFKTRVTDIILRLNNDFVIDLIYSYDQTFIPIHSMCFIDLVRIFLRHEFGDIVFNALTLDQDSRRSFYKRRALHLEKEQRSEEHRQLLQTVVEQWPQIPPKSVVLNCLRSYRQSTIFSVPVPCTSCTRLDYDTPVSPLIINSSIVEDLNLNLLLAPVHLRSHFVNDHAILTGLMLDNRGLSHDVVNNTSTLSFCDECLSSLRKNKLPKYSLANSLYRGQLPSKFADLTWVEEMVCCIYQTNAYVTRVYGSTDESNAKIFKGNTCAFEMNVVSTATELPRVPADINNQLTVVFVGPSKYKIDCLKQIFRIRKKVVWEFLLWLKEIGNPLYQSIPLSKANLDLYSENNLIPNVEDRVIVEDNLDPDDAFAEETAGIDDHPALALNGSPGDDHIFLEKMGVSDPDCVRIEGRTFTASALRNLVCRPSDCPDLIIHHGQGPVPEYKNPALFPGMYPTLFPLGIGSFEDPERKIPVSFAAHVIYLLSIADFQFRYHHSFIFVVHNILQRRQAHLHTALTVSSERAQHVINVLRSVSADTIISVAAHLEHEKQVSELNSEQLKVFDLLREVNTIAAKLPGSEASKLLYRNEIRSYTALFGIPLFFFTFNPNSLDNPMFQVYCGDSSVNLDDRFPVLVSKTDRALRLAKDPVAAVFFFEKCIETLLEHLLGWDIKAGQTKINGGLLGHLKAYYGTKETTERGGLHAHFVLWPHGALNPSDMHQKLKRVTGFEKQLCDFLENIIWHHIPDTNTPINFERNPRVERPLHVPDLESNYDQWETEFLQEVKLCAEKLQRHECRKVCHKYGNENNCRFDFPHDIVLESYFDHSTNALYLLCRDPNVNYYNPFIIVFTRNNHDIKCIFSGKAAKAAMFYITDYMTKGELKSYQILSLLSKAVATADDIISRDPLISTTQAAKTLLHKCLSQLTRQYQIHAQQAVSHLLLKGDTITSHKTVPMLSGLLMKTVKKMYHLNLDLPHEPENENSDENINSGNIDQDNIIDIIEPEHVRLDLNSESLNQTPTQIHHYLFRDNLLHDINFYEFVQRFGVIMKNEKSELNENSSSYQHRSTYRRRYSLQHPHSQAETHVIVEKTMTTNYLTLPSWRVPRVIGLSIPRPSSHEYHLFVLAHLKPFSITQPLITNTKSPKETFESTLFSDQSLQIMKNWEAVHECEDERDAERIRKRQAQTRVRSDLLQKMTTVHEDGPDLTDLISKKESRSYLQKTKVELMLKDLDCASFFERVQTTQQLPYPANASSNIFPPLTTEQFKRWNREAETLSESCKLSRLNALNPSNSLAHALQRSNIPPTSSSVNNVELSSSETNMLLTYLPGVPPTESSHLGCVQENTEDLLKKIMDEGDLNFEQRVAFQIVATEFLKMRRDRALEINDPRKPDFHPYRTLFLSGPGGTGKTYAIKLVKKVMKVFHCENQIIFLAPTASAANNIAGCTIHSALKIKVRRQKHNTGERDLDSSYSSFDVEINVELRDALRASFKGMMIVVIDEVSMVSQRLLALIDHQLQCAMENHQTNGGLIVVYAGDFYQLPPVGGTPLYKSIKNYRHPSNSDEEFLRRLGRLTWKKITDVVILKEQQRMKTDLEFAQSVNRLRIGQCTQTDVHLFNSRAIKTPVNPKGINMITSGMHEAIPIVPTNYERYRINTLKAAASVKEVNDLVLCSAFDEVIGYKMSANARRQLLESDMSSESRTGALPSSMLLYEGMPIILRHKNLYTDLGIVNGARGILRKLVVKESNDGYTHAHVAIIEFPDSRVHLEGLPPKYFPIYPTKWSFKAKINLDEDNPNSQIELHTIIRTQFPFEPAFAITAHGSQGKTVPKVHAMLHQGGRLAYVAVSRAMSRDGLTIQRPVTLDEINTRIDPHLLLETVRHEQIAMNTLIRLGFQDGQYIEVVDPEDGWNWHPKAVFKFIRNKRKRGNIDEDQDEVNEDLQPIVVNRKTPRLSYKAQPNTIITRNGCQWDSIDWSCAYDCLFMLYHHIYSLWSSDVKQDWSTLNLITRELSDIFKSDPITSVQFNAGRDRLRNLLSIYASESYNIRGQVLVEILPAFSFLENHEACMLEYLSIQCDLCGFNFLIQEHRQYVTELKTASWQKYINFLNYEGHSEEVKIKDWETIQILESYDTGLKDDMLTTVLHDHKNICSGLIHINSSFKRKPPLICYIQARGAVLPRVKPCAILPLRIDDNITNFMLSAIIFHCAGHFVLRLISTNEVSDYNSDQHEGKVIRLTYNDVETAILSQSVLWDSAEIHAMVYIPMEKIQRFTT